MLTKISTHSEIQKLLNMPGYVPWQINGAQGQVIFRKLGHTAVYNAAFLDHRLSRSENETLYSVPITALISDASKIKPPKNWIFHTSFCCSTLLARLLQIDNKVLSMKEPIVLNQLADAFRHSAGNAFQYISLFRQVAAQLNKPFSDNQTIILKTSNYMNALLNQIHHLNNDGRVLLVWGGVRAFARSMLKNKMEAVKTVPVFLRALQQDIDDQYGYLPGTDFTQDIAHMWATQIRLFCEFIENTQLRVATVEKHEIINNTESVVAGCDQFFCIDTQRSSDSLARIMKVDSKHQNSQPSAANDNHQDDSLVDAVEQVSRDLVPDNVSELLASRAL